MLRTKSFEILDFECVYWYDVDIKQCILLWISRITLLRRRKFLPKSISNSIKFYSMFKGILTYTFLHTHTFTQWQIPSILIWKSGKSPSKFFDPYGDGNSLNGVENRYFLISLSIPKNISDVLHPLNNQLENAQIHTHTQWNELRGQWT